MAGKKETPLTKQYNEIKSRYPDTILLFRLGDFYETFGQDAVLTAKCCGITLTKRNNGAAGKTELAGFPHHQLDNYLPKLVKAGYRVAVCEQLEDPKKAKGIVKRGVTEVVTPGVALYDKMLDAGRNNFVMCVKNAPLRQKGEPPRLGCAWLDISTGELYVEEISPALLPELISNANPSELVIDRDELSSIDGRIKSQDLDLSLTKLESWIFDYDFCMDIIGSHFPGRSTKGYGFEEDSAIVYALGGLLHYIKQLQGEIPPQISGIKYRESGRLMNLDYQTRRNLEITYSNLSGGKEGSLYGHIDETKTAMGSRLLKNWISAPLKDKSSIEDRHNKVESLFKDEKKEIRLESLLSGLCDMERIVARVANGRYIPRDFRSVADCLGILPSIVTELEDDKIWESTLNPLCGYEDLFDYLSTRIADNPPSAIGSGNSIKSGVDEELDDLKNAKYTAKTWLDNYREELRQKTGISTLKTGQNNVFGYYIEIGRTHSDKLDLDKLGLTRKQTLANAERYVSKELAAFEEKLLTAETRIAEIEERILRETGEALTARIQDLQKLSHAIAQIDTLRSFAALARKRGYVKPEILDREERLLEIRNGRHPVVERILPPGQSFTSNDTELDAEKKGIVILTGPNMAGKSIYLRQNGLIVLLAQAGSFVPASKARISVVDRIFTRVGAQDNLAAGESTFLVEMQETASILNSATEYSLLLLDEIGRGTATYDGISLAWAIAEHINQKLKSKAIFATHYHELAELEQIYEGIINRSVEVKEMAGKVLFTHKVVDGHTDHSFGIHVASMAGVPVDVLERAKEIMTGLEAARESGEGAKGKNTIQATGIKPTGAGDGQLAIFTFQDDELRSRLKSLNIEHMTPVDAFRTLAELIDTAKKP